MYTKKVFSCSLKPPCLSWDFNNAVGIENRGRAILCFYALKQVCVIKKTEAHDWLVSQFLLITNYNIIDLYPVFLFV